MKNSIKIKIALLFILINLLLTGVAFAQAPQGFNYQATVRNAAGALIVNQNVNFKFNLMQNSPTGVPVYSETHYVPTDDLGAVNLVIGQGTPTAGTFSAINWGSGNYYMGIELNTGSGYIAMGTTQLLSVPYALFAGNTNVVIPTLKQVLDSGNTANKTVTDTAKNSINLNTIGGNTSNAIYSGLLSVITGTNGSNRALQGYSNGNNLSYNEGVLGFATNSMSENVGTYGAGYGSAAYNTGVKGEASGAIDGKENCGVIGRSTDFSSTGKNYGVIGIAVNSEVLNIAVGAFSDAASTTNSSNYGILSRATATTTNGTNYGIYSEASNGAINYAGVFNGNVTITGTLVQPSDKKLKKEIKPFTAALDKIKAMKPVTYYYKTEKESGIDLPKVLQHGFIAQDIETIFPELVTTQVLNFSTTGKSGANKSSINPDETATDKKKKSIDVSIEKNSKVEFKGINYSGLISILTEAIKEQQVLIEGLKSQNKLLTKRIYAIENKLKMK